MSFFKSRATRQLDAEIGRDLDQQQQELFLALVRDTPIDTGNAQRGWRNVAQMRSISGTGQSKIIIRNDVPYIQRLDEGHSSQKPAGFVKQVIQRTRNS